MKIASSAALNFQTRFTRAPVGCSSGYFLGVSHGQCHVLSGSLGFSGSFGGGGGAGAGVSAFGLAVAVHSGMTLPLASAAVRNAGSPSFGSKRFMNATRYGPINQGCASANVASRSGAGSGRADANLGARLGRGSMKSRGIAATKAVGARAADSTGLPVARVVKA